MKLYINFSILTLALLFIIFKVNAQPERCVDYQLLDASEELIDFGFDTTYNWWAKTKPYSNKVRIHINDFSSDDYVEIKTPVFSPNGVNWAFFAKDITGWVIVNNGNKINVNSERAGELVFSADSRELIYSYFDGEVETVITPVDTLNLVNKDSKLFVNNTGTKTAFVGTRGGTSIINNSGRISEQFDRIIPVGYWHDNRFAYAAFDGSTWSVYIGDQQVSDYYQGINDIKTNLTGDFLAFIGVLSSGNNKAVLVSDKFREPIIGRTYDKITGLAIHPHSPMMAYRAVDNGVDELIVFNSTKYHGGRENSIPRFTYDGSEMYFFGCTIDCFLVVNGRKIDVPSGIYLDKNYALKPKSNTIAYTTSTSLVMRDFENNVLYGGKMMDFTGPVRYNWREDEYESLGVINNRLYLQTCGF